MTQPRQLFIVAGTVFDDVEYRSQATGSGRSRGTARGPAAPGLEEVGSDAGVQFPQRAFAELIGTAALVFIGAGSVPAILLLEGSTKAPFLGDQLGETVRDRPTMGDEHKTHEAVRRLLLHRGAILQCRTPFDNSHR